MGDHAIASPDFSYDGVAVSAPVQAPIPPQVLARWAALAAERSCVAVVPRQLLQTKP